MRLAYLLRHRRRLLMQVDRAALTLKRPSDHSEFSTAVKYAKTATSSSQKHSFTFGLRSSQAEPEMPSNYRGGGKPSISRPSTSTRPKTKKKVGHPIPFIEDIKDQAYILKEYADTIPSLKSKHVKDPLSVTNNVVKERTGKLITFQISRVQSRTASNLFRCEATCSTDPPIRTAGDAETEAAARKVASLAMMCELNRKNMFYPKETVTEKTVTLSDGSTPDHEKARQFMDWYCKRFNFAPPTLTYTEGGNSWETVMTVEGRKIGMGVASSKKVSTQQCYLDVVQYLEKCDAKLWSEFQTKLSQGLVQQARMTMHFSSHLQGRVRDLVVDLKSSELYKNRPSLASGTISDSNTNTFGNRYYTPSRPLIDQKSQELLERQRNYNENPSLERMRVTRKELPVYSRADEILTAVEANDVTILMAATGSGKTTQVPQIILDQFITKGEGGSCNIMCTQPRRLAALSVAHRVASERGEQVGKSVGYVVRFESRPPEPNGSINFCTIGVFLKMLQTAMSGGHNQLDSITHIVVDEVHERDVDTDLLLVVLKRLLTDRKARGKPIKIILMSATIDPTLFRNYFPDQNDLPAPIVEVPGRTFPVKRHHLDDFFRAVTSGPSSWVLNDDSVVKYAIRELGVAALPSHISLGRYNIKRIEEETESEIEIPYPLIASTIAHVLSISDSGHVLTFLAGWEDITAVQKLLLSPPGYLPINFNDQKYSIHLLHSSVPLAEQQVIFDPPKQGVRRIILATNIAETSVTIPDVVYVVDSARLKEQRYDPDKHISSLVSAWVGSSNLNQRAGRAGRHRPGEYYGVLSQKHASQLQPYQTVEMSRVDLSNVVMHVKALNFPGMSVEEVLAATIEPPLPARVASAMKSLQMFRAIDEHKNLTSLGRVLLQIPVDVQVGRLVLLGSFFRCLDQALTLAALITNRDPFMSPMSMKEAAAAARNKWCPSGIKSDALTALNAYNAWEEIQSRRDYSTANRFCIDNFLSKPTLLLIQKLKIHLLQSLYTAGVIDISAGGGLSGDNSRYEIPHELNQNGDSMTLLASLIALSCQPKFAFRASEKIWRTQTDKATMIHPSSVNHPKHSERSREDSYRQMVAFIEKRQNVSAGNGSSTFLVNTTRLEPLLYVLFGAHHLEKDEQGLLLDHWVSVTGNLDALDDVYDLRMFMDSCMTRVFEGIVMGRRKNRNLTVLPREEQGLSESGDDAIDDAKDYSLSKVEVKELDLLSRDLVNILTQYSSERGFDSRPSTRAGTPMLKYPGSGHSTPFGAHSQYNSRASTPSGRFRKF